MLAWLRELPWLLHPASASPDETYVAVGKKMHMKQAVKELI